MNVGPRPWTGRPEAYLQTTARLLAAHEPRVRAFTHVDRALLAHGPAAVDGRLGGMPIAVKEIIDVAGQPTTYGSDLFATRVPIRDAEPVALLRDAGAVVLGMTTTTPFACGTTTVTDNPVVPGHTPGGSSAGSAAAVGAGFVPVALGSQSQASTLRPASYCGVWGFKPSHGRLPVGGMHLLAPTLDDLGILAASLADLVATFSVLAAPRPGAAAPRAELSIGRLHLDDGGLPDRATVAALDRLLTAVDARFPVASGMADMVTLDQELAGSGTTCFDIFTGESAATLASYVAAGEPDPRLAEMVQHASTIGLTGLATALERRDRLRELWAGLADHVDVVVSLATTGQAPAGHATTGCRRMPATSSLLGIPALSAPWLTVGGRPQGVQLLGFEGRDEELLTAAAAIGAALTHPEEGP